LPGIAGIILAIGMAVDSNVIIFTRIKEEIAHGKSVRSAVQSGFRRALGTVIDAQVTTLIAAVILYQIGTSSVKGFAFTLLLGIIVSIFTAVAVTQLYLSLFADSEKLSGMAMFGMNEDGSQKRLLKKNFRFIANRKKFYAVSLAIILLGTGFFAFRGFNKGIDFTGGTMFQIDMGKHVQQDTVKDSLEKLGIDNANIVYSGDGNREVIIRTTKALDNAGRKEVLSGLQKEYKFDDDDVLAQELFGPSVGRELSKNAVKAVLLAAGYVLFCQQRLQPLHISRRGVPHHHAHRLIRKRCIDYGLGVGVGKLFGVFISVGGKVSYTQM
jgi:SecD/SecF fusion protein